ncbi:phosphate-starvation-inducible PsiE family protein [Periweissella ghanensis]|uniref:Protein PsiE n=1 Tax=Periweissella ghanensis TaxID=467997 RepID=A0ABM8ZE83_9LACO|nr:phosphate-starvation-inducible PsiE family protein [Periweissella ghanensis]MCM0600315.1 phosphate-starvation-inducible PsiE family protein [Periweissella ghanensis]CAH0419227.1 Protein PsiE [Periweissella ghanensis]
MNRKYIDKTYAFILDIAMIALGIIMMSFFAKEIWNLASVLLVGGTSVDFYKVSEMILETFMFFEFAILTREYFVQDRISLQNFIYIGITAMLRNLLVIHNDTLDIMIQAAAISLLMVVFIAYNLAKRHILTEKHHDERDGKLFVEEHPNQDF